MPAVAGWVFPQNSVLMPMQKGLGGDGLPICQQRQGAAVLTSLERHVCVCVCSTATSCFCGGPYVCACSRSGPGHVWVCAVGHICVHGGPCLGLCGGSHLFVRCISQRASHTVWTHCCGPTASHTVAPLLVTLCGPTASHAMWTHC